ncbi:MAG: hypothetical protein FLDDKLPJ_01891 [Phycisphaerae bacterium]|nr:hypothetical protein [Phycisphaerae bacterium]
MLPAVGSSEAEVRLVDGRRVQGPWLGWSEAGAGLHRDGAATIVPAEDVLEITFTGVTPAAPVAGEGNVMVHLAGGGRIAARLGEESSVGIAINTPDGEARTLPLSVVEAVQFAGEAACPDGEAAFAAALRARRAGEDVLIACASGEVRTVGGVLESLGAESGRFRAGSESRTFRTARMHGVVLATPLNPQEPPGFRVHTRHGWIVPGALDGVGDMLHVRLTEGVSVAVPSAEVTRIERLNPRVVYVSDLPRAREHVEGVLLVPRSARNDENAARGPLRLDGRDFPKGVGMHARTAVTYDLSGEYETFFALVGVDDSAGPGGSVVFRVEADGKTVFDSGRLTASDGAVEARLSVVGADSLTLICDVADGVDIGDLGNWADARVIKPSGLRR